MSSHSIVFDIETSPLSADYLDMICPEFTAPANYKDEEKISAYIAGQKATWVERAALSPMTGRVLCIGIRDLDGTFMTIGNDDESLLLQEWGNFVKHNKDEQFVGFNIFPFDVPFLIKRCWKLGVKPFVNPLVNLRRTENWIDLRDVWQMGDRQAEGSLDSISKFLGIGAKTGEGKDFHLLWKDNREAALKYLENDIALAASLAERLGVLS